MTALKLGSRIVGLDDPTYFVADISANHDGDLERAKLLIRLCAEAGADAAKFQNFQASKIVSDQGFQALGKQLSHQSEWKKSVFQVYQAATLPWEWTPILKHECEACGIDYFSTPYDLEAADMLDPYVDLFKIGYSWGGVTSLAVAYDFHGTPNRPAYGHRIVRLNIGLEEVDDLQADLAKALATLS